MADNILKAIIQVDASGVNAAQQKVSAATSKMETAIQGVTPPIQILEKQFDRLRRIASMPNLSFKQQERLIALLNKTQTDLNKFKRAVDVSNPSIQRFAGSSNAATLSMINLGRVVQDAPFGFLGIANNLNPLLESFQSTTKAAGGFTAGLKAMGKSLVGAGGISLALSVVSAGLIVFGDKLFGSKTKADESAASLERFKGIIDKVTKSVSSLKDELQFLNQLSSINIKINNLTPLLDLQGQKVAQDELVQNIIDQRERLVRNIEAINNDEKLTDKDRADAIKENNEAILSAEKELVDAQRANRILVRLIALQKVTDAKEAHDKETEEYKQFVSDTISRGKELAKFFEGRRVVPTFTIFDTTKEEFEKALKVIREFEAGGAEIKFRVPASIEPIFETAPPVDLAKQIRDRVAEIQKATSEGLQDLKIGLPGFVSKKNNEIGEANKKIIDGLKDSMAQAAIVANGLASAFSAAFDALLSGESVMDALSAALKRLIADLVKAALQALMLIADLVKAALQALIFKAIANALTGAGLGALGGRSAISGNFGGIASGVAVTVSGELVGRGNSLVAVISNTNATIGRTGG